MFWSTIFLTLNSHDRTYPIQSRLALDWMLQGLCQVATLLFLPRAGRGEWYEKTSLSNGDEVAAWVRSGPGPAGAGASGLEESRNLKSRICIKVSMPLLSEQRSQVTVNSLLLPPFRWSRTGFQIVTVLMWLKDEFCAKFLFVQLISSIDSTFNPIGRCHSYCFSI